MTGPAERDAAARANELYWGSAWGVNQIADELELSKGVLYGMIRPKRAGLACPMCGEEVVYANRTAKERGQVACAACGWEGDEEEAGTNGGDGGVVLPLSELPDEDDVRVPPIRLSTPRSRAVLAGALLGAAAGLALVLWARNRRR